MSDADQIDLFDYIELIAIALGRKKLDGRTAATALLIAKSSDKTRGTNAYVPDTLIAAELGIGRRSVWRYVEWLITNGWLEQTQRPTRGTKGTPGRKAKYRLLRPVIDLGIRLPDTGGEVAHETGGIA